MFSLTTHLLYLHGFRSSPQSAKAQRVARWVQAYNQQHPDAPITWCCPPLPPSPEATMGLLRELTASWPADGMAVMGSSLGGFYATAVVRERGCKAWLINPAVAPARDLAQYLQQPSMPHPPHENRFFDPAFVGQLQAIDPHPLQGWRTSASAPLGVLIAKGDEVLDWREMHAAYAEQAHVHIRLLPGSDHTASDFEVYLPEVLRFLGGHRWDNPSL